ncbi:MAG TPA: xanthine dehydrogenase family protein molybdopterin-binding subunit [Candidatus Binataceae bacterium]|nr:xanthine dehydrogenase family protein molybdopterin-binding subunit [Candidatus Binataceae bacterium]
MGAREIGARVKRTEDLALVTGRGNYVGDLKIAGLLHVAFLRSPYAHALIRSIAASRARALPGVRAVLTWSDLPASARVSIPMGSVIPQVVKTGYESEADVTQPLLARDEVCYVGQTVAAVVAENRYLAEDAAELIEVDYEELPAVGAGRTALEPGTPRAHLNAADNVACKLALTKGDADAAFRAAPHVFRVSLRTHRGHASSMEGRAAAATVDPIERRLTVWSSCQAPHNNQRVLAQLLDRSLETIRVVAPDVGGGFGPKAPFYAEEGVVAVAAEMLSTPVRWLEDRREHFLSTTREGDQFWDVEIALDAGGKIQGVRGSMLHDNGAYLPIGIIAPHTAAATMHGPYVIPNLKLEVRVVFSNTVPNTVVRGAGRIQGVFAMERMMDRAADGMGIDRAELRRRNFIQPDQMPYSLGLPYRHGETVTYDSGDYPACQAQALLLSGYAGFAARQAAARAAGRYLGLGIANFVEGTGLGPFEAATVRVLPTGKIVVYSGSSPQGQGHKTTLAQVCADQLGVKLGDIAVTCGDTGAIAMGVGTVSSRSAANAGSAVQMAAGEVRRKLLKLAARDLEALEDDLELSDGRVHLKGVPDAGVSLQELFADSLSGARLGGWMPRGISPGLDATASFVPSASTFCNGTHVVEVEVDIYTGLVRIVRYIVAHDCGNIINPLIVEGQIQGGVAHGIGNALFELMAYDEQGQPLTANFADYTLPTASAVPPVEMVHLCSPTPLNPLGVKGAGEGGTIPAPAAIIAAVENALAPFGVQIDEFPLTPLRIIELLQTSQRWESAVA